MEILACKGLTFSYPGASRNALQNVSFSISRGDFVAVCGATGSGKSTLLRLLKREIAPLGEIEGEISVEGVPQSAIDARKASSFIGFVAQRPEEQIVTDKVYSELAFGLENLGTAPEIIRRRVAETAAYFGMDSIFSRPVSELSGGQKQMLNLAAVMAMQPSVLILDEPTSQLDPIAASEFISVLAKLNRDFAVTVIISEHRPEELLSAANKLLVIGDGKVTAYGDTRDVIMRLRADGRFIRNMPSSVRVSAALDGQAIPVTAREGRVFIENNFNNSIRKFPCPEYIHSDTAALEFSKVYFRYERTADDVLRNMDLTVYDGEIFCLLGGNGSGKTTALNVSAGLLRPYCGKVRVFGRDVKKYENQSLYRECLSMLPQDVQTVFLKNTVREELEDADVDISSLPYDLTNLLDRHPYDVSGGEQQLVALAKVLATKPKLLLLDEPTKGLDADATDTLIRILKDLQGRGVTVVAVTHDISFAALCADRCALFFDGGVVSNAVPREFFGGNYCYTTPVSRMTRGFFDNAVTVSDAVRLCRLNGRKGEM